MSTGHYLGSVDGQLVGLLSRPLMEALAAAYISTLITVLTPWLDFRPSSGNV